MEVPWQQTGTHGFLAANRDPRGFLDEGDVMSPSSVVHLLNRSMTI